MSQTQMLPCQHLSEGVCWQSPLSGSQPRCQDLFKNSAERNLKAVFGSPKLTTTMRCWKSNGLNISRTRNIIQPINSKRCNLYFRNYCEIFTSLPKRRTRMKTYAVSPLLNSLLPTACFSRCSTDSLYVSFRMLLLLHASLFLYNKI